MTQTEVAEQLDYIDDIEALKALKAVEAYDRVENYKMWANYTMAVLGLAVVIVAIHQLVKG